jgi:hypothetical protein
MPESESGLPILTDHVLVNHEKSVKLWSEIQNSSKAKL